MIVPELKNIVTNMLYNEKQEDWNATVSADRRHQMCYLPALPLTQMFEMHRETHLSGPAKYTRSFKHAFLTSRIKFES